MTSAPTRSRPVAAIAGIYEYPLRVSPGTNALQIKAISAVKALAEAGLKLSEVDALFDAGETSAHSGLEVAEYLGINPSVLGTTDVGGSSFEVFVADACRACYLSAGLDKDKGDNLPRIWFIIHH